MAGEWASALGQAILGGQDAFQRADIRQRAYAQQQFENNRQIESDKLARDQFTAKQKIDALNSAILQDQVNEIPKKHAEGDINQIIKMQGPIAARNDPNFVKANEVLGTPLQTAPVSPRLAKVRAIEAGAQTLPSVDPVDTGIAPDTGVKLNPADVLAQRDIQRKEAVDKAVADAMTKFSQPGAMNNMFEMDKATGLPANTPGNRMKAQQITHMTGGQVPVPDLDKMYGPPKTESWRTEHITDPLSGETRFFQVNDATAQMRPVHGAPGGGGGGVQVPVGVTGEDALKNLDPKTASIARMLADYKLPTNARSLSQPAMRQVVAAAQAYDPTFDPSQYDIRQGTKKDYATGKAAQQLLSLNKMILHSQTLEDSAQQLGNHNGVLGVLNPVENWIGSNIQHHPQQGNFDSALHNLRTEAEKFLSAGNLTDTRLREQGGAINSNSAPDQIKGYLDTVRKLALEQGGELQRAYNTRMGGKQMPMDMFSPATTEFFKQLNVPSNTPRVPEVGPQNAPSLTGQSQTVTLVSPDGKQSMTVPADQAQHYIALGAKVVPGR